MEAIKSIFMFLIFIAIVYAIFYGIWKLNIKLTLKRSKKMNDTILFKSYKGTRSAQRWIAAILFCLFLSPVGSIYFYFLFKKMHSIYHEELLVRGIDFEEMA